MRLLLDTQAWLWWLAAPERIDQRVLALVASRDHEVFVSVASVWELMHRHPSEVGLPRDSHLHLMEWLTADGFKPLPIELLHIVRLSLLRRRPRDLFDGIILAQAQTLKLRVVTTDPMFSTYDVDVVRADQGSR